LELEKENLETRLRCAQEEGRKEVERAQEECKQ